MRRYRPGCEGDLLLEAPCVLVQDGRVGHRRHRGWVQVPERGLWAIEEGAVGWRCVGACVSWF